jgi:glycosyltransferase involved in cell wall biosynthesis
MSSRRTISESSLSSGGTVRSGDRIAIQAWSPPVGKPLQAEPGLAMKLSVIRASTIIPAFNNASTIAQAVDSALAQEFDGDEVIVVNDGSTDDTLAVLARYSDRIRVIDQPNSGPAAARNAGAAAAQGEYLAFLDADDIWLPGRLALTCGALDRNPAAVLSFADLIPMDRSGTLGAPWVVGKAPSMDDLLTRGWGIYPSAVTMRRKIFEACGGFEPRLTAFEDIYLWLVAREHGEFAYVAQPLVLYRTIDFSLIADKYRVGLRRLVRLMRQRYGRAAGRSLNAELSTVLASSLIAKAVAARDRGHLLAAIGAVIDATRFNPWFGLRAALRAIPGAKWLGGKVLSRLKPDPTHVR